MSSRSKGMFYERKAKFDLMKDGYLVYRVPGSTRFNKEVDMFNLFDMLALKKIQKENSPLFHIERRYIQVKTNKKLSPKEQIPFKRFKDKYCDAHDSVWIYTWWQKGKRKKIITEIGKSYGWEKFKLP